VPVSGDDCFAGRAGVRPTAEHTTGKDEKQAPRSSFRSLLLSIRSGGEVCTQHAQPDSGCGNGPVRAGGRPDCSSMLAFSWPITAAEAGINPPVGVKARHARDHKLGARVDRSTHNDQLPCDLRDIGLDNQSRRSSAVGPIGVGEASKAHRHKRIARATGAARAAAPSRHPGPEAFIEHPGGDEAHDAVTGR
jgi:hypothetical protein